MSVHVISWVLRHSPVDVAGHRLVLVVLADHAQADGGGAFPSVATTASEAKQSERNVQYATKALEAGGHIERQGVTRMGTTIWRVLMGGANFAPPQGLHPGGATSAPKPSVKPSEPPGYIPNGSGRGGAREAWATALASLAESIGDLSLRMYVEPLRAIELDGHRLLLGGPDHVTSWVRERYGDLIARAVAEAVGRQCAVEIVAVPADRLAKMDAEPDDPDPQE